MTFYLYYQETPESKWIQATEDARDHIVQNLRPPFTTILAMDPVVTPDMTADAMAKIKYKGPLYFDFDSPVEDRETVIEKFQAFLKKLIEKGVSIDQVELYASGGKGFHAIVSQSIFLKKPPPSGIVFLPAIYKEMAQSLYVNTLDLAIYSARKGRMFRTVNVQRPNGKYKVALTYAEVEAMTPELYETLTSTPRPLVPIAEPVFSHGLATEFAMASDKVTAAVKNKAKHSPLNDKLLAKFKGEFPPSMIDIMNGETKEGVRFQSLAMQLACAANALGKSEEELIAASALLIANHEGDGIRYNSPKKREAELIRMHRYTENNPCYTFSVGGLKSVSKDGAKCADLDDEIEEDGTEGVGEDDDGVSANFRVNSKGIFHKVDGIMVRLSDLGITEPEQLVDLESEKVIGYEVNTFVRGKPKGKKMMEMSAFSGKSQFQRFTLDLGASLQGADNHAGALADLLRNQSEKRGTVYTVGHEGIDVVTVRSPSGEYVQDVIYASKDGVISLGEWNKYRLRSLYSGENGHMNCDIHNAKPLEDTPLSREFFTKFFKLNSTSVIARCFGWYMAAYLTPFVRKKFNQFPMLQIVGPAGAGKSQFTNLLVSLHYSHNTPKVFSASTLTPFALDCMLNASSSIPLIFDELKASEMDKRVSDKLRVAFRSNYNGLTAVKGRVDHAKTKDALGSSEMQNRAPLSFIGESLESQTAIVDRCIIVPMNEEGRRGTDEDFSWCLANKEVLSQLGRVLLDHAMRINPDRLSEAIVAQTKKVRSALPKRNNTDRPAFNYGMLLVALEFGKNAFKAVFGEAFDEVFGDTFERLHVSVFDHLHEIIPRNMSEASKVLNVMAHLSKEGREDDTKLKFGEDYMFFIDKSGKECVDIKLRTSYDKYRKHIRAVGEDSLYPNFDAMVNGFREHPAVVSRTCFDNAEFKGGPTGPQVYRFDLEKLETVEGIEQFDCIPPKNVVTAIPKVVAAK